MRLFRLCLVSFLVSALPACLRAAGAPAYKGAIVLDAASGDVLFEDNADYVGPPASITKLMTFLVVTDQLRAGRLQLSTPVTTLAADAKIGGTQVWLKEGEVFPVEDLLLAMMIQSANDAAHALARASLGSREAFVTAMNERASALGMTATVWRTPHGLPPTSRKVEESDVTSPRDLARLSRELLRQTDILRYTTINRAPFGEGKRPEPVMMDNHNNLIGKLRGVDGLKTGYTRAAGFCLAATAEREGRRLIAIIMGSPTSKERDLKMAQLLEEGFAKLGPAPVRAASPVQPADEKAISAPSGERPVFTRVPAAEAQPAPTPADSAKPKDPNEPPTVRFTLPK